MAIETMLSPSDIVSTTAIFEEPLPTISFIFALNPHSPSTQKLINEMVQNLNFYLKHREEIFRGKALKFESISVDLGNGKEVTGVKVAFTLKPQLELHKRLQSRGIDPIPQEIRKFLERPGCLMAYDETINTSGVGFFALHRQT